MNNCGGKYSEGKELRVESHWVAGNIIDSFFHDGIIGKKIIAEER